jgi:hypothetical protein
MIGAQDNTANAIGNDIGVQRAVVGQYLVDLDRRSELQTAQEIDAAFVSHVAVDVHENPARSTIDGHEEIAT